VGGWFGIFFKLLFFFRDEGRLRKKKLHVAAEHLYTRYCQYFIAISSNKGGRGENVLRNIVGNKGGLQREGGIGYCTIMCNNTSLSVSRTNFFRTPRPIRIRLLKNKNKSSKDLKNTSKLGGGVQ